MSEIGHTTLCQTLMLFFPSQGVRILLSNAEAHPIVFTLTLYVQGSSATAEHIGFTTILVADLSHSSIKHVLLWSI